MTNKCEPEKWIGPKEVLVCQFSKNPNVAKRHEILEKKLGKDGKISTRVCDWCKANPWSWPKEWRE